MRFEYKQFEPSMRHQGNRIECHFNGEFILLEEALNRLGAEGWELVGFSHKNDVYGNINEGDGDINSNCEAVYIFKRLLS